MGIQHRIRRLDEIANERWLGISTTEWHQVHHADRPDFRGYGPTSYRDWRIIRPHIDIDAGSCFVDYGAGLGRSTILAARERFGHVIGMDLDANLVARGNENIRGARGLKCPAEIICADAATFDIPDDASVLYFCNPFVGKVLASALEKIRQWIDTPRLLQVICNLPERSAFEAQIMAVEWLTLDKSVRLTDSRKCCIFSPCP